MRRAALTTLREGIASILNYPAKISNRGYQSYIVLSVCRILYTLQHGDVASKPVAAGWARQTLGTRWIPLIDRAWEGRHQPDGTASTCDVDATLDLIRYALARV